MDVYVASGAVFVVVLTLVYWLGRGWIRRAPDSDESDRTN